MAILDILEFPDARLRTIAKPVDEVDASVQQLIDDMFETMYAAPGIGLAATQVNVHRRVVVMDISEDGKQPLVFINPEVRVLEGGTREYSEGCLSVPGFHELVMRPENIVSARSIVTAIPSNCIPTACSRCASSMSSTT
jgi:peptide deformylase